MKSKYILIFFIVVFNIHAENTQKALVQQVKEMALELNTDDSKKIEAFILKYSSPELIIEKPPKEKMDAAIKSLMKRKDVLRKFLLEAIKEKPEPGADNFSYIYRKKTLIIVFRYHPKTKRFHIEN